MERLVGITEYNLRDEVAKLGLYFESTPRKTSRNDFVHALVENRAGVRSGKVTITDINSALKNTCKANVPAYLLERFMPKALQWRGFAHESFKGLFFAGFHTDPGPNSEIDLNESLATIQLSTYVDSLRKVVVPDSIKISGIMNTEGYISRIVAIEYQPESSFQMRAWGISVGRTEVITDKAMRFPVAASNTVTDSHVEYPGFISERMVQIAENGKIMNKFPNRNEMLILLPTDFGTILQKAKYSIGIQPSAKWLDEQRELAIFKFKNVDYNPTEIAVPWKLNNY